MRLRASREDEDNGHQATALHPCQFPGPRFITVNGRRVRLNKPAETDPKKRVEAVRRAATRIKTTARIDTIILGRD
jgi:hypothetical protein